MALVRYFGVSLNFIDKIKYWEGTPVTVEVTE